MQLTKVIFYFLLILSFFSCQNTAQEKKLSLSKSMAIVDHSELVLNQNLGLVYHHDIPFTGYGNTYSHNILLERISYLDGKKEGVLEKWFPSGKIGYQAHYSNGKLDGISKTWWKNGNLRSESNFIEGKVNGTKKQWYKSGAKFKEINLVNGQEEGMQKAWRENGAIYNNYEAKNGRIFGLKRATLCFELDDEKVQYAD